MELISLCFNLSALKVADIILFGEVKNIKHKIIKSATASEYAHAALYMGEGKVIEAIGSGVIIRSILYDRFTDTDKPKVLRLKYFNDFPPNFEKKIIDKAEKYIHRAYFTSGALFSVIKLIPVNNHGMFFCSHLIAHSYNEAGINVFNSPEKIHPGDILKNDAFIAVSDPTIPHRIIRPEEGTPYVKKLMTEIEGKKFQKIYKNVVTKMKKNGVVFPDESLTQSDLFLLLTQLPRQTGKISNIIDKIIIEEFYDTNLAEIIEEIYENLPKIRGLYEKDKLEIKKVHEFKVLNGTLERVKIHISQLEEDFYNQQDNANLFLEQYEITGSIYGSYLILFHYYNRLSELTLLHLNLAEDFKAFIEKVMSA